MSKHVREKCGNQGMETRTDGRTDGESDGRRPGQTDGHHHTIIRSVWRRAHKNSQYVKGPFSSGYFERYVHSKNDYLEPLLSVYSKSAFVCVCVLVTLPHSQQYFSLRYIYSFHIFLFRDDTEPYHKKCGYGLCLNNVLKYDITHITRVLR